MHTNDSHAVWQILKKYVGIFGCVMLAPTSHMCEVTSIAKYCASSVLTCAVSYLVCAGTPYKIKCAHWCF